MDQELLDTSRYKITTLSVDSRFADRQFACTGDFQLRLPSATKNIMRVLLASVEIPNVEWVFSAAHGNLQFEYSTDNGVTWTWSTAIAEGNYTPSLLVAAVDAKLSGINGAAGLTLDPLTNRVALALPAGLQIRWTSPVAAIAARPTFWGLGYYLGFRSPLPIAGPGSTTAPSVVTTEPNPYYLVQLLTPDPLESLQHRLYDGAWVGAFAKIVMRNGAYTVDFDDGGNMVRKDYTFVSPTNITNLRIRLLDPFGDVVDLHDVNWSLTLELYEVMNSRVYSTIAETFQRR